MVKRQAKNRICIIHFQPLEKYPPITNLIDVLTTNPGSLYLTVITTINLVNLRNYQNDACTIIRYPGINEKQSWLIRFFRYTYFYIGCIFNLIWERPGKILYYETLSSFPALVYYYLSLKRTKLLVHYHEYTSPVEYKSGMFLETWFHTLEQKIYPKVSWSSHTNEKRMELFLNDNPGVSILNSQIMPNYPSIIWAQKSKQLHSVQEPVRIVYVGSVSSDTMYFPEFIDWLIAQQGKVLFDIYSFEYTSKFRSLVEKRNSLYVTLNGPLDYHQFPDRMKAYHIGVILYKGVSKNVIYCASNKLFEYLACGLDVWVSDKMKGSEPFVTKTTYPKVSMVDFENLKSLDLAKAISREGLTFKPSEYFCEPVYAEINRFLNHA